jgi:CheY-like chemotaxis protein
MVGKRGGGGMVEVGGSAGGAGGSLSKGSDDASEAGVGREERYSLLNDQPVENAGRDLLGMTAIAEGLASVITASMGSSPFVLAVDAGWGMGKSTLLRRIEYQLSRRSGIVRLRFNAWTAEGGDALEGLIKAVLGELDRNVLRRWIRRLGRRRNLVGFARLALALVARFFGVARLVDELWERMGSDAKSRNELRDLIHGMLSDWIQREGKRDPGRALVVFIDDLDRCSDDVIVKVCEAVKLYLDAPGLIFIMACDQSVLARGVSVSARGGTSEGRAYLEKVVQVAYRMPPAKEHQLRELIRAYAAESGTAELIDDTVSKILAEGTGRNPRRIKRIINSFVIEYRLDPAWRQPPLGSAQLVTAILLQHVYTPFYDLLVSEESVINPIDEFLDYVQVREKMSDPPADGNDPWWGIVKRSFKAHHIQPPGSSPVDSEKLASQLEVLERQLPEGFPGLARNNAFIELLHRVEQARAVKALRAQLIRQPLATASDRDVTSAVPTAALAGWRVVCVDDNPESLTQLVQMLEDLGASVKIYSIDETADQVIRDWKPDAVISDITRGEDPIAGFTHIAKLRKSGYAGPVAFFTARVTPERRRRAEELHALGVFTSETAVIQALSGAALRTARRDQATRDYLEERFPVEW